MNYETKLEGTYTALITPFKDNGEVNYGKIVDLVGYQLESGIDGILALGTTAETPTLSEEEKNNILEQILVVVNNQVPVMVGTGTNCTRKTIENTLYCQDLGTDMALIVTPYYNKPTQKGIYQHFKEIHDNTEIPIVVYNIEGRTGVNIETSTLAKIAEMDRVIGVKEASGNINQIGDVIYHIANKQDNFSVMSGDDAMTLPAMVLGAEGVISVTSNLFPETMSEIANCIKEGNYNTSRSIHEDLILIFKAAFVETNPAPIKYLMNQLGLKVGGCRLPLTELSTNNKNRLKNLIVSRIVSENKDEDIEQRNIIRL